VSDAATAALATALALVVEGKHVFPCAVNKRPTCPNGFKAAGQDPAYIDELWRLHPGELVGVATGKTSGFDVLDLDAKHEAAREWWVANRTRLPATLTHRTRSGGLHLHLLHAEGLRCSAGKIVLGVDVRADGGYVIHWPSAGLPVLCEAPIAPWPQWLLDQLMTKSFAVPKRETATTTAIVHRRLAGLVRAVASATKGSRNRALFWAACRVGEAIHAGEIDDAFGAAVLERAAERCGLSQIEARRTISSGIKSAAR
jgi:hypothetical protein